MIDTHQISEHCCSIPVSSYAVNSKVNLENWQLILLYVSVVLSAASVPIFHSPHPASIQLFVIVHSCTVTKVIAVS